MPLLMLANNSAFGIEAMGTGLFIFNRLGYVYGVFFGLRLRHKKRERLSNDLLILVTKKGFSCIIKRQN